MRDKPIIFIAGCLDALADHTMTFVARVQLESRGFAVIDEYDLPREKGLSQAETQRFGLLALECCDLVCFLPDWEKNTSATYERNLCHLEGKMAVNYEELLLRNDQMLDLTEGMEDGDQYAQ